MYADKFSTDLVSTELVYDSEMSTDLTSMCELPSNKLFTDKMITDHLPTEIQQ